MKIWVLVLAILMPTIALSCGDADLKSSKSKYSYAIGIQIGNNIKRQGLEIDPAALSLAIEDIMNGKKSRLSQKEISEAMNDIRKQMQGGGGDPQAAQENMKKGEEYLAQNKTKRGVQVTGSGLQYEVLRTGSGPRPGIKDRVQVHYRGTLIDGTVFDSSYQRKKPAEFQVNRLIPGWTEALQLMNTGSKYRLTIPSNLGYGGRNMPKIPANSVLVFELELIKIVK